MVVPDADRLGRLWQFKLDRNSGMIFAGRTALAIGVIAPGIDQSIIVEKNAMRHAGRNLGHGLQYDQFGIGISQSLAWSDHDGQADHDTDENGQIKENSSETAVRQVADRLTGLIFKHHLSLCASCANR